MGQLIDEDDCEVCVPFDQEWIFTYGDLVTLLLCFFILLFSMCRLDVEKITQVSQSFRSLPPGSHFVFGGQANLLEKTAQDMEQLDIPDEVTVNVSDAGVEVTFKETVLFESNSVVLTDEAKAVLTKMLPIIAGLENIISVEGHTDGLYDGHPDYPNAWEFSAARAAAVADFLVQSGLAGQRVQIAGYGDSRPRFFNDTPYRRALNRRVEILVLPEFLER